MNYMQMLELAAHGAAILTAVVAVWAWVRYLCDRYKKRLELESHLRMEKALGKNKGQRTLLHLTAKLGMTEADILDAAFRSKHICRRVTTDEDGMAKRLMLEYRD